MSATVLELPPGTSTGWLATSTWAADTFSSPSTAPSAVIVTSSTTVPELPAPKFPAEV